MDLFDLTGQRAVVTGAASGLGRAMAEGLHEAGAAVALIDISEGVCEIASEMDRNGGARAVGVRADLSRRAELQRGFHEAVAQLGGIDILLTSHGIQRRHRCEEFPAEDWDQVLEVNLNSVFLLCQLAGREMLAQGHGKIITVSSLLAFSGGYTVPAYAASKGGVAQLSKALTNEWAARGININAIAPGYFDTPMNVALVNDPVRYPAILSRIPAGRWGKPDDLKGIAIFLASRASDYLNGAVIPVDGGWMAR